ncbi:MAG: DUF4430 domain-containing protein [Eubacterium sp.]
MRKFYSFIALLLSVCMLFSACSAEVKSSSSTDIATTANVNKDDEKANESTALSTSFEESSKAYNTSKLKESAYQATAKAEKKTGKNEKESKSSASVKNKTEISHTTSSKGVVSTSENVIEITEKSNENFATETVEEFKTEKVTIKESTTVKATEKETSTTTTTASEITCSVKIECSVILENMDNLKAGHSSYVPSDGIILDTYTVTMPSGSTAYDALERACSDKSIKINAQKTAYGVYVAGINNIDEKDCGKSSGWLYSVNDAFPQKSCGLYKLSNGDKVVFSYTC